MGAASVRFLEFITFIGLNIFIVMVMQHFHGRNLELRLKRVTQEIQELENLVAAMIEELEEAAGVEETSVKEPETMSLPLLTQEPEMTVSPVTVYEPKADVKQVAVPVRLQDETGSIQAEEQSQSIDDKRRQVLTLRSQGMDVADIARKMGIGRGEVNLILGLYQRS